mmetsp:Transcript_3437/g.10644  ORF Transcript_3437/g.10644 Transcript_3437/m.10644 type:complete len:623 (-) Transcript_3437:138-2006(-)
MSRRVTILHALALGVTAETPTLDLSCRGCPLRSVAEHKVESENGRLEVTLTVDVVNLITPNTTFKTRLYNGALGGPRLVLQAGDKVELTLVNNLLGFDNTGTWNTPRKLNTTNLHLHGMHISGKYPGDDIRIIVPPQGTQKYEYEIPEDHLPGHHWYHPHHHGGTALQSSGGMYGSIEVHDPEFKQPPEIEAIPVEYIEVLNMPFAGGDKGDMDLENMQSGFNKALLQTEPKYQSPELLLVNGGSEPVISMKKNQWYRYRIGYFSSFHNLWTVIKDAQEWMPGVETGKCEWQLMGHDGNYLDELPRKFGMLPLTQASRVEILLRCTEVGTYSWESIKFGSTEYGLTDDDWTAMFGVGSSADGRIVADSLVAKVATFEVAESTIVAEDLPVYALNRPCYVASTLDADESTILQQSLAFTMDAPLPNTSWPSFNVNGREYAVDQRVFEVPVGGTVEYTYIKADYHSAHIHINPVQLVVASNDAGDELLKTYEENPFSGFALPGDWFDTLIIGTPVLKARQHIDRYVGPMVVHCHLLIHEDYGMMSTIHVTGKEGTRAFAPQDLTYGCDVCYTGATGGRGYCYKDESPTAAPTGPPHDKKGDAASPLSPRVYLAAMVGVLAAVIA